MAKGASAKTKKLAKQVDQEVTAGLTEPENRRGHHPRCRLAHDVADTPCDRPDIRQASIIKAAGEPATKQAENVTRFPVAAEANGAHGDVPVELVEQVHVKIPDGCIPVYRVKLMPMVSINLFNQNRRDITERDLKQGIRAWFDGLAVWAEKITKFGTPGAEKWRREVACFPALGNVQKIEFPVELGNGTYKESEE